jgi:hypothetical protein
MPNTTVFLLDIIDSNSLHGPVRELHQDNGISNQINQSILLSSLYEYLDPIVILRNAYSNFDIVPSSSLQLPGHLIVFQHAAYC